MKRADHKLTRRILIIACVISGLWGRTLPASTPLKRTLIDQRSEQIRALTTKLLGSTLPHKQMLADALTRVDNAGAQLSELASAINTAQERVRRANHHVNTARQEHEQAQRALESTITAQQFPNYRQKQKKPTGKNFLWAIFSPQSDRVVINEAPDATKQRLALITEARENAATKAAQFQQANTSLEQAQIALRDQISAQEQHWDTFTAIQERALATYRRYQQYLATKDQYVLSIRHIPDALAANRRARKAYKGDVFITAKPDSTSQDAVAMALEFGRVAIADGATNHDASGVLARGLVRHWIEQPLDDISQLTDWVLPVQDAWQRETAQSASQSGRPSFVKKDRLGASTFLGVELKKSRRRQQLNIVGVGDSVVFLVRKSRLKKSFPLIHSSQFSNTTAGIPSSGAVRGDVFTQRWDVAPGDEVFLATDAQAKWIFQQLEAGRDPFSQLRQIKTPGQMAQWVDARRIDAAFPLDTDDTTLMRFVIADAATKSHP